MYSVLRVAISPRNRPVLLGALNVEPSRRFQIASEQPGVPIQLCPALPIEVTPGIIASHSNLLQLQWANRGLAVYFAVPADNQAALRVQFQRVEIIRIIEEMPISTEYEETSNEGIVADHFAYEVQGASFWNQQSEAFKVVYKEAKHYRSSQAFIASTLLHSTHLPLLSFRKRNSTHDADENCSCQLRLN